MKTADNCICGPESPVEHRTTCPQVKKLIAEVREWICIDCNIVYPGPPAKGAMCLICPECGGHTVKRFSTAEVTLLRSQLVTLAEKLRALIDALTECITDEGAHCLDFDAGRPKLRARIIAINKTAREALAKVTP